jgi:hypothetical protein
MLRKPQTTQRTKIACQLKSPLMNHQIMSTLVIELPKRKYNVQIINSPFLQKRVQNKRDLLFQKCISKGKECWKKHSFFLPKTSKEKCIFVLYLLVLYNKHIKLLINVFLGGLYICKSLKFHHVVTAMV